MTLDVMSNSPFVSSKNKAIWKENLEVKQTSLRAFFDAPLQLGIRLYGNFSDRVVIYCT